MASATFRDESATGRALEEFSVPGLPERISARELVRPCSPATASCRWVGDRQIEDLDVQIDLAIDPVVSFVKLVPLVGG